MMETVSGILTELVLVLISAFGVFAIAFIKAKFGTEKMIKLAEELANKKEIVALVVLGIQQVWKSLEGEKKLILATEEASAWLQSKGLKFTPQELRSLIEGSVKAFKQEFGDAWWEAVQTTTPIDEPEVSYVVEPK